uniref:Uncharacterized protein n=1 Tax=Neobacillus citreus TaxID=2833578 RepID=A0A942T1L2_9BACI
MRWNSGMWSSGRRRWCTGDVVGPTQTVPIRLVGCSPSPVDGCGTMVP